MRKKYLSALLFGALLVTSAGTFTSCKDYDDDINNLQEQITANADAIKALEELVKAGKYVSGVAIEGQVITFTFSDGSTTPITIPEGEKGQTVEVKDNELYIDGEATGIKVAEAATAETGLVKAENGTWWVLGEDGEYTNTNIPVSGVTVSGSEADGYTFTIYDANGGKQTVKLPTAVSSITEMTLGNEVGQAGSGYKRIDGVTDANVKAFLISSQEFTFKNKLVPEISDASKWPGNKKLPNNGDRIFSSPTTVDLRIDPVNVDATTIDFYLTNTKNTDLSPVVLNASASQDSNDDPLQNANGRAAVTGNGLWTLSMDNITVAKDSYNDTWTAIGDAETTDTDGKNGYVYAVNANHGFRSKYELKVQRIKAEDLKSLYIMGVDKDNSDKSFTFGLNETKGTSVSEDDGVTFKTGKAYKVNAVESSALYDMYLTADDTDKDVYGLTFDQDSHTFTIGKNPDVSSIPAEFELIVYTVANDGTVNKSTVTISINTEISAAAEYTLQEHSINKDANKNYFGIDLSTMKTALGDNLNQWMQNVDLEKVDYQWSADNITYSEVTPDGFAFDIVEKLVDIPNNNIDEVEDKATIDRNKANFIQVSINNTVTTTDYLKLGHTYYIKATFKTTDGGILNSIVVPVKFNAPALSAQFVKESAVFKDGGNTAYAYMNYEDQLIDANNDNIGDYINRSVYKLSRAFSDMPDAADAVTLSLDNQTVVVENTQLTSENVADFVNEGNDYCSDDIMVELIANNNLPKAQNTNLHVGYGKELTIKATGYVVKDQGYRYKNTRWLYASTEDATYTFNIKVMSPIYEGTVTATDNIITIPATGSAYNLSNNDIKGTTYNNIAYKVLPDKVVDGITKDWNREEIASVSTKSNNENVFKVAGTPSAAKAYKDNEGKTVIVEGTLAVTPQNIAETTESTMTITVEDVWGYKKPNDIKVKITVGE